MDKYISNVLEAKKRGFNVICVEVAYPPFSEEAAKYKDFFKKHGIELTFARFIGEYNGKQYHSAYTEQENELFEFNKITDIGSNSYYQKGSFVMRDIIC